MRKAAQHRETAFTRGTGKSRATDDRETWERETAEGSLEARTTRGGTKRCLPCAGAEASASGSIAEEPSSKEEGGAPGSPLDGRPTGRHAEPGSLVRWFARPGFTASIIIF